MRTLPGSLRLASAVFALALLATSTIAQVSTDVIVESVADYGPGDKCCPNAIPNGDGFATGLLFPGSRFTSGARYTNTGVYDTDFISPARDSRGRDSTYFDRKGRAFAYFTGHGVGQDGCSSTSCTSSNQCKNPSSSTSGGNPRLPGACRFSPFDPARCCYMVDRALVTRSTSDQFNGVVNYTAGPIAWGESPQSGAWARAGTDGGANVVVLDISHGVLPPFWVETFSNASVGIQLIATMMTGGGDTNMVAERGPTFASFYRLNEHASVAESWVQTMNALPVTLGSGCEHGTGGRGFNGCGCNFVIGFDSNSSRASASLRENWINVTIDSNDALGRQFFAARWVCNYAIKSSDKFAFVLP